MSALPLLELPACRWTTTAQRLGDDVDPGEPEPPGHVEVLVVHEERGVEAADLARARRAGGTGRRRRSRRAVPASPDATRRARASPGRAVAHASTATPVAVERGGPLPGCRSGPSDGRPSPQERRASAPAPGRRDERALEHRRVRPPPPCSAPPASSVAQARARKSGPATASLLSRTRRRPSTPSTPAWHPAGEARVRGPGHDDHRGELPAVRGDRRVVGLVDDEDEVDGLGVACSAREERHRRVSSGRLPVDR